MPGVPRSFLGGQRSLSRRRLLAAAAQATGAAVFVGACGHLSKRAPRPTAGAGAARTPKSGGQLNFRVSVDPIDYDPSYNGKTAPGDHALAQAYNSLLRFENGPDVDYTQMLLAPRLAERWEIPDPQTFIFHLRSGVRFAGLPPVTDRELTSGDVRWSTEYYSRSGAFLGRRLPHSAIGFMFEGITAVETPDTYTVTVRFERPFLPFLSYAASDWNAIAPREIAAEDGDLRGRAIGSGPYQLDGSASQKSTRYVWRRNASYWNSSATYVDRINWLVLPDDATAFSAFQAKQVDILENLAYPAFQQVQRACPQARFFRYLQPQGLHLHLSQAHGGPLADLRVRQAISMSVDRDEISKLASGGTGQWALPGAMQGLFTDAEARRMTTQDLQEARALLGAAGYGGGLRLEWPVSDSESQASLSWFQLVQAQVKRAGIELALQPMSKADQRARRRKGDFDIDVVEALGLLEADADSVMFGMYHSRGSTNWVRIRDPELDTLLEAQRSEVDPAKRPDVQRQAVRRILDMAWGVELIYPPIWTASQPYVENYYPHFSVHGSHASAWLNK